MVVVLVVVLVGLLGLALLAVGAVLTFGCALSQYERDHGMPMCLGIFMMVAGAVLLGCALDQVLPS